MSRAERRPGTDPTIGMIAIGRPTFDLESAGPAVRTARAELRRLDPVVFGDDTIRTTTDEVTAATRRWPDTIDVVVIVFATFADATLAAAAVGELATGRDRRVVLWSLPEPSVGGRLRWNSMCGAILAAYRLAQAGVELGHAHRTPGHSTTVAQLTAAIEGTATAPAPPHAPFDRCSAAEQIEVERVVDELTGARVGVVGQPPPGFEPCHVVVDPSPIGSTFEFVELETLFSTARSDRGRPGDGTAVAVRSSVGRLVDIELRDQAAVEQSLRLHDALHRLAQERRWDAVAVRCWPECFTSWGGAACAPLSFLADAGLPAACEADGYGALTSLLLSTVARRPAFLTDLVDIDPDENTATFWHCGMAPRSMADPTRPMTAIDHPNRGIPLALDFGLGPGPITMARISQSGGGLRMVIGRGEVVDGPRPFTGTSGTVACSTPVADLFDLIIDEGLEHHVTLVPGHHQDVLAGVARQWGMPVVRLTG